MIVFVGFMGAGKSTVGRLLARRLGLPFADSDRAIEQRLGRSIEQIFAEDGEQVFRGLEQETIAELLRGPDKVVSLGGGAVQRGGTRRMLRPASVIYLQISYDEVLRRIGGDTRRPLLRRPDLKEIYERRLPLYQAVAGLTIPVDGRHPEAVCLDIIGKLAARPGLPPGRRGGYPR